MRQSRGGGPDQESLSPLRKALHSAAWRRPVLVRAGPASGGGKGELILFQPPQPLTAAGPSLRQAKRNSRQLAVLHIDLDHFKPINDTFGHAAGDLGLAEVARRLRLTI
ncbi:MAG: diguanylate cyclase [Rhodospirillales bacterium]|nr:diguanylate cyclase [Rhodospirillales bacterium]